MMFFKKRQNQLEKLLKGNRYISGKYKDKFGNIFHFPDQQSFAWTYKEIFERKVYFFKSDNRTPYIIDCGANIGVSVIYFKNLFPECKILAIEADPFLCEYLKKNIELNNLKNIQVVQKAVWNETTVMEFLQEKSDSGRLGLNESFEINQSNKIQVETTLLSDYIDEVVAFLKMDIEGAEWIVLKEIERKLNLVEKIFIESHSFKNEKQDLHQIINLLFDNKFRYYLTEGYITTINPFLKLNSYLNMDLQVNIHALKN